MEKNKKDEIRLLEAKSSFLQEMITKKVALIDALTEKLKRLEGHSSGSKDLSEKIGNFIKKQQSEVKTLEGNQKLTTEISNFVNALLEGTRTFVRGVCGDVERLYFAKQGEYLFLKDEIDDLNKMKLSCEQELKDNVPDPIIEVVSEVVPEESKPVENVTKAPRKKRKSSKDPSGKVEDKVVKEPKKKITRPDRDPTTKIGRAALDIAERKRKHREKISK